MKGLEKLTSLFKKKTPENKGDKRIELAQKIDDIQGKMKDAKSVSEIDVLEREARPFQLELQELDKKEE